MRVFVVDDDADVRSVVSRALAADGHVVMSAGDLESARLGLAGGADLLVLDLSLPDGSGLELCRALRSEGSDIPILMLTARSEVALRVQGLDAGADDYLSKPFAVAELRARVRALGRRGSLPRDLVCEHGSVRLDFAARRALRADTEVAVTSREWAILELLCRRSGRIVSRHDLLQGVWGEVSDSGAGSLEVLIARLRRKLGSELIRTLRGEGYALAQGVRHERRA